MKNTFPATDTLKGIGIVIVVINHYLNMNLTGDFLGFANVWITVFFVVSGYGISSSIEKRYFREDDLPLGRLFVFYYNRAVYILPLFVAAMILESLLRSKGETIFLIPGKDYGGHYWFVLSILQCYLAAPLIYYFLRKKRMITIGVIMAIFVVISLLFEQEMVPRPVVWILKKAHADYRELFFLNILIFSLAMCLPFYLNHWDEVKRSEKHAVWTLFFGYIMLMMISSKYYTDLPLLFRIMSQSLNAMVFIFLFCVFMIANLVEIGFFSFLGRISYSIYLFHKSLFVGIDLLFGLERNSAWELLVTLVFLVAFVHACIHVEAFGKRLSRRLALKTPG